MAWNSSEGFMLYINEAEYKANVDYVAKYLKPFGYEYAVIDAGWYQDREHYTLEQSKGKGPDGRNLTDYTCDQYGRPIPHPVVFPSAKDGKGFGPLAEYVHKKGLKFGIHLMREMSLRTLGRGCKVKGSNYLIDNIVNLDSKCIWSYWGTAGVKPNHPASQAFYNSIFELLAEWKVDFVKYDDLGSPFHLDELIMIRKAIANCGRKIVLSLSPGDETKIKDSDYYSKYSSMWRVSPDTWDKWADIERNLELLAQWNEHWPKKGWPDGDAMPMGYLTVLPNLMYKPHLTNLSIPEMRSMMTGWSFSRSPLIITSDLRNNPKALFEIETQKDLINIDQNASEHKVLLHNENSQVWFAKCKGNSYVALLNVGEKEQEISYQLPENVKAQTFTDIWTKQTYNRQGNELKATIAPHDCRFFKIK